MTRAEIAAFNMGVMRTLDIARQSAAAIKRVPGWKPTREGAADALDAFAEAARDLLIGPGPDDSAAAHAVVPKRPLAPAGGEYVGLARVDG